MKKAEIITAIILTASLVFAQGWHIYFLANTLSMFIDSPIAKNFEAIYLSIGLASGLFFVCIFDGKNKKVIKWLTWFELSINWLCWLYIVFFDKVFYYKEYVDYSDPRWNELEYVGLLVSLILSTAIPLLIRVYAKHIDLKYLFKRSSKRRRKSILDE